MCDDCLEELKKQVNYVFSLQTQVVIDWSFRKTAINYFRLIFYIMLAKMYNLLLAFSKRSLSSVQERVKKSSNVIFWTGIILLFLTSIPNLVFYTYYLFKYRVAIELSP